MIDPSTREKSTSRRKNQNNLRSLAAQSEAKKYLKALCRIYLIDYICADYDLPLECARIADEVAATVLELENNIYCALNPSYCSAATRSTTSGISDETRAREALNTVKVV